MTATELAKRLRFMAKVGDLGRKPDPDDVRRQAATAIEGLEASLRIAVWNYAIGRGLSQDAALAAVEFEIGKALKGASAGVKAKAA